MSFIVKLINVFDLYTERKIFLKLNELLGKDIKQVIQYPKIVGKHNKKDVILHIGPYGIYMKYNNKNYRINKLKDHSLESLSSLIKAVLSSIVSDLSSIALISSST